MGRLRVSDIIKEENMKEWKPGDIVTISAGTDSGKSFFIKNSLYQYAKARGQKILMLVHRRGCKDQFQMEIQSSRKADVISILTYQALEANQIDAKNRLNQYDYIVADEFHYFTSDARFNMTTDISFEEIMQCTSAIKIFMSATGEKMARYIKDLIVTPVFAYELEQDWSFIRQLTFFRNYESMDVIANEVIGRNEKAIFFIENAEIAYEMYTRFADHAVFNCSVTNSHHKYVDEEKVQKLLREQRFDENLLITTSCMDAGLNLIDPELKTIVVDNSDTDSLIQCLGRKRRQFPEDKILVYIKRPDNRRINMCKQRLKERVKEPELLKEIGSYQYAQMYGRSKLSSMIYTAPAADGKNIVLKVNELMLRKRYDDIGELDEILELGTYGYCQFLAERLGRYDPTANRYYYDFMKERYDVMAYMQEHVGEEMLTVADRETLIKVINLKSVHNNLLHKAEGLNWYLEKENIPYRIISKGKSKTVNGVTQRWKAVWKIVSLEEYEPPVEKRKTAS